MSLFPPKDTMAIVAAERDRLRESNAELLAALILYVKLDNDNRAGCRIEPADWGECNSMACTAIARTKDERKPQ